MPRKPCTAKQGFAPRAQDQAPAVSPRRADAFAVGALAAVHLAFWWRALALQGVLIHSDICYFFEPMKALLHDSLRAGRLPLWSPYIYCGYPVAAEGQIAAFYPISLLLSWLLPSSAAVTWLVAVHVMLAALGSYALARHLVLSPFASFLSGLTFSFSGYLFAHIHHVSLVCAAAWLPWVVLFVEHAWRGPLLPNAAGAALAWGAAALCGHPQTVFLISLAVAYWLCWRWLGSNSSKRKASLRRLCGVLGLVLILGAGVGAVQLLLTAELSASAPHGERGSLEYVTSFSLLPRHLVGLVAPNWQGTPAFNDYEGENYYWEYVLYLGLAPLALAVVGGMARRGRALALLGLVSLALALARGNPLYEVVRLLPGFSEFRVPARFIFLFTFAAALLAGVGWEAVARWHTLMRGRRLLALGAAVVALTGLDLVGFARTLAPLADSAVTTAPNAAAAAMQEDREWWRAVVVPTSTIDATWVPPGGWAANPNGWIEARALLPSDVPQSYGLHVVGGYAGFVDPGFAMFERSAYASAHAGDMALLSLVGTRYLALPPWENLPLPKRTVGPFLLYRNPEAFPRAFAVSAVIRAASDQEAHRRTVELARAGRLRQAAVVQGEADLPMVASHTMVSMNIEQHRPEHVVIIAEAGGPCLLVLNERWDRGWRAAVDGRAAPLLKVDGVLMGAPLPGGRHQVEFRYHPWGLLVGRVVSLAAAALCAYLLAAHAAKRRLAR